MAEDLMSYLRGREVQELVSEPLYSRDGDFLTFLLRDVDYFAERLDDLVTVYLEEGTEELVGCKIKGVRRILDTLGHFGVSIKDGPVKLGFFFLPGLNQREEPQRRRYAELGRLTRDVAFDPAELRLAS